MLDRNYKQILSSNKRGPYQTVSLKHKRNQGLKHNSFVAFQLINRTDTIISLKQHFGSRSHHINTPKRKYFQIFSFKGSAQNVKPDHSNSSSKLNNPPIKLSPTQEADQVKATESPDVCNHQITFSSEDKESATTESLAIKKLFRKWILMLRTQSSDQEDAILGENTPGSDISEGSQVTVKGDAGKVLKSIAMNFMKLDAAISLPLLIIVPLYLTVRIAYGAEVAKELTPMWVLGPLVAALHVKIIQALCSYVFCITSAIKLARNLPSYYSSISNYISEGKLREYMHASYIKPIEDVKNTNFKHFFGRRMKQLRQWAAEKYLDYVESVWPFYCRTIRFLKKANLI